MRIARFNTGVSGFIVINDEPTGELMVRCQGYTRLTEYVEVGFPPLPPDVVVEGQLKHLDAAEQELREKFQQKLNELTEARSRLRSISHEAQS